MPRNIVNKSLFYVPKYLKVLKQLKSYCSQLAKISVVVLRKTEHFESNKGSGFKTQFSFQTFASENVKMPVYLFSHALEKCPLF